MPTPPNFPPSGVSSMGGAYAYDATPPRDRSADPDPMGALGRSILDAPSPTLIKQAAAKLVDEGYLDAIVSTLTPELQAALEQIAEAAGVPFDPNKLDQLLEDIANDRLVVAPAPAESATVEPGPESGDGGEPDLGGAVLQQQPDLAAFLRRR